MTDKRTLSDNGYFEEWTRPCGHRYRVITEYMQWNRRHRREAYRAELKRLRATAKARECRQCGEREQCEVCGEYSATFHDLLDHLQSAHPDPEQIAGPDDPEAWAEAQRLHPEDPRAQMAHYSLSVLGEPDWDEVEPLLHGPCLICDDAGHGAEQCPYGDGTDECTGPDWDRLCADEDRRIARAERQP